MRKAKTIIPIFLFLALVIITAISVFMPRQRKSSNLTEQKQESENVIRIDYVDDSGRITFATDKGYATRVETREYESSSRIVRSVFSFLDETGRPVALSAGYDELRRTYNTIGEADTDTYYLNGKQVARKQGYYQYARSYNKDGKVSGLRYLDQDGNLVDTTMGYAEVHRTHGERTRTDMYYDAAGNPAKANLGQYGLKVEKAGDVKTTTYLDAEGKPANTTKGFAVVKKEGSKSLYYDKDGTPVTVGRGQYGVEKDEDGQSVYLDEEGEPMLRLDNFLNTHPVLVLILGILVTVIALLVKGKWRIVFLILYLFFIGIMTIAYRETGDPHGQFVIFSSFRRFFDSASARQNILNNVWLFVPLGAALYTQKCKWLLGMPIALSVLIEAVQYFAGIGLSEIDDVITNSLGGLIGYGCRYLIAGRIESVRRLNRNKGTDLR